ncbi:PEP/pyruvate-binding domain-containing protein [Nonomuraea sp. NPDC049649]|uniref:PEP/pyruvate-binding domain-containing protein n=1 Tax=Nonomuraea sp. NPDC049649 TaxID=3155776 RepID=UPI00343D5408
MLVPLGEADADTCGGKAGALGTLLRAGLPVPGGFVVPFAAYRARLDAGAIGRALAELGDPPVAVRSSASGEDGARASAAGQHESFLAVCGAGAVAEAVRACWASLYSPRAVGYRAASGGGDPVMAVIVQRQVDAEVSGVMFTGEPTRIEASYGLGPSVVEGKVTPDSYAVTADGPVSRTLADKRTRLDRRGTRLVTTDVPAHARNRPAIDDATARRLAAVGERIAAVLGGRQDIEWAITGDDLWILQSRPVTAALPPPLSRGNASTTPLTGTPAASLLTGRQDAVPGTSPAGTGESGTTGTPEGATGALNGTPGSRGSATGAARIVRGPGDFARVRPGDILVCPYTDPAWTPLLRIAAGVVTETGGVLSHAAIVAREYGIPAVLGVRGAMDGLRDGALITVDGNAGTVTTATEIS